MYNNDDVRRLVTERIVWGHCDAHFLGDPIERSELSPVGRGRRVVVIIVFVEAEHAAEHTPGLGHWALSLQSLCPVCIDRSRLCLKLQDFVFAFGVFHASASASLGLSVGRHISIGEGNPGGWTRQDVRNADDKEAGHDSCCEEGGSHTRPRVEVRRRHNGWFSDW